MVDNNKSRQKYLDFLKKEIQEYCNTDGCYEVYFDYRDEIPAREMLIYIEDFIKNREGFTNFKDYLEHKVFDECYFDYDDYLFAQIKQDIYKTDDKELIDEYLEDNDFIENLESVGYNGVAFDINELLCNTRLRFNIMFATDKEQNYDMGSIVSAYGNDYQTPFVSWSADKESYDNALTYLIHQQGHTVDEVLNCLLDNPRGFSDTDKFVTSVVNDIVNNSSEAMSELTVLVELSGENITTFVDMIDKGNSYLVFDKNTDIGIFNEWSGCGGLLEINLDKPFVVPANMVRNFQIENSQRPYEYTVNEVYGLNGSCWKDSLSYTDKAPEFVQEDINKTLSEFQKMLEKEELEQER